MNEVEKNISRARASIVVALEQALNTMGDNFVKLGKTLSSPDKNAVDRATYLQSDEARAIWASVTKGDVEQLRSVIDLFDRLTEQTAQSPAKYQVYMDFEQYTSPHDPNKLDNLRGISALLKTYLIKAGLQIEVEPFNGYYFFMVISRPSMSPESCVDSLCSLTARPSGGVGTF